MRIVTPDGLPVVDGVRHYAVELLEAYAMRSRPNSARDCLLSVAVRALDSVIDVRTFKKVQIVKFADRPGVWEKYDIPGGIVRQIRVANDAVASQGFQALSELIARVPFVYVSPLAPSRQRDYVPPDAPPNTPWRTGKNGKKPRPTVRTERRPNLRYREVLAEAKAAR